MILIPNIYYSDSLMALKPGVHLLVLVLFSTFQERELFPLALMGYPIFYRNNISHSPLIKEGLDLLFNVDKREGEECPS